MKTEATISFEQHLFPALESGDYKLTVEQKLTVDSIDWQNATTQEFSVGGERFSIKPEMVLATHPAAASVGDFNNVLPHLILNRNTFPWERSIDDQPDGPAWLAILLFSEEEKPATKVITLDSLINGPDTGGYFPPLRKERAQALNEQMVVIDIERDLLETMVPKRRELELLCHIRNIDPKGDAEIRGREAEELAVVVGKRIPEEQTRYTAHLVSLEDRYQPNGEFNFIREDGQEIQANEKVRLVSLFNWSFQTSADEPDFHEVLGKINEQGSGPQYLLYQKTSASPLLNLESGESEAALRTLINRIYELGYVPLEHHIRNGQRTLSWYRSPLTPGSTATETLNLQNLVADELLRYDRKTKMLDTTYAAAWQLGRMLALQDQSFSTRLYQWKRRFYQFQNEVEDELHRMFLDFSEQEQSRFAFPDVLRNWLEEKALLKDVPFQYLVPDATMLPEEAIRFFKLDDDWVRSMLDGAFSIGRVDPDETVDQHDDTQNVGKRSAIVTGFLLRSKALTLWTTTMIEGYGKVFRNDAIFAADDTPPLKILRQEKLANDVLFVLFNGHVKTVDIHQKRSALHYGVDRIEIEEGNRRLIKTFRKDDGTLDDQAFVNDDTIWQNEAKQVVDFTVLASNQVSGNEEEVHSGIMALRMIESPQKIRFSEPL